METSRVGANLANRGGCFGRGTSLGFLRRTGYPKTSGFGPLLGVCVRAFLHGLTHGSSEKKVMRTGASSLSLRICVLRDISPARLVTCQETGLSSDFVTVTLEARNQDFLAQVTMEVMRGHETDVCHRAMRYDTRRARRARDGDLHADLRWQNIDSHPPILTTFPTSNASPIRT